MARRSDGEEEVALVNVANAAATSLFSPNMWVRRPSRVLRPDPNDAAELNTHPLATHGTHAAREGHTNTTPGSGYFGTQSSRQKRSREDQDLSYLEASDREGAEKEQIEADLAHIAVIEAEIMRAQETSKELRMVLQEITAEVHSVHAQNCSVKRMFGALGVCKADFDMDGATDEPARKRRMVEIGQRLVKHLSEPSKTAAKQQQQQQQLPPQPARRGRPPLAASSQTPAAATQGGSLQPGCTPPASFPAESQIAAASLTLSQGDPAVALLSLLEKALAARSPPSPPPSSSSQLLLDEDDDDDEQRQHEQQEQQQHQEVRVCGSSSDEDDGEYDDDEEYDENED